MQYAQIIPNTKTDIKNYSFTYKIPPELLPDIQPGCLVQIPFANRKILGLIIEIRKHRPRTVFNKKIKTIEKILTKTQQLTDRQIKLAFWLSKYYFTPLSDIIFTILPMPLLKKTSQIWQKIDNPNLTKQDLIFSSRFHHYQKLIRQTLKLTKQTIILFPQVELAEKFFYYFAKIFPKQVILYHSKLSKGEKWRNYQTILNQDAKIIIGSQSAIFSPAKNLGQIIIDSADSPNYKQDRTPKYDARKVAQMVSQIQGAEIIFVSPTIPLDFYQEIKSKKILWQKPTSPNFPKISIVDMNQEKNRRNFGLLSEDVKNKLTANFKNRKKSILFINKKGAAAVALCQGCRHIFRCPNCDSVLAYRAKFANYSQVLICHSCSYQSNLPGKCPNCQGINIKLLGGGTEKVEIEAKKLLPAAKVLIMEKDLTKRKISEIKNFDIVVTTSSLFFDYFQPASLVAMILPDLTLNLPDFRAAERTFQQIEYAKNYAENDFIIQTYYPENWLYQTILKNSDTAFYTKELSFRKKKNYPPFARLIKLVIADSNSEKAKQQAKKLADQISQLNQRIEILGPAPAYSVAKNQKYLWQMILKGTNLAHIPPQIPKNIKIDIDPVWLI